jgi:hypothetical protein
MAIVVNSKRFEDASWGPFNGNPTIALGPGEGPKEIWIGLRNKKTGNMCWNARTVCVDLKPPSIKLNYPSKSSTSQPLIQIEGQSSEPLSEIRFDVVNTKGTQSELEGFITLNQHDSIQEALTSQNTHFKCFDVELAQGDNTITVRVKDEAGNQTSQMFKIAFEVSNDRTPPAIEIQWPKNNDSIAGDACAIRGRLDDPTAEIMLETVEGEEYFGQVERNGQFWLEHVPLLPEDNTFKLRATDAAGNTATTSITVRRANLRITIDSMVESKTRPNRFETVNGTFSGTDHKIWVNGIVATQSGNYWTATNVPMPEGGTALIQVKAIPMWDNDGNGNRPKSKDQH